MVVERPACRPGDTTGTSSTGMPLRAQWMSSSRSIRSPSSRRPAGGRIDLEKTFGVPLTSQTARSNSARHWKL